MGGSPHPRRTVVRAHSSTARVRWTRADAAPARAPTTAERSPSAVARRSAFNVGPPSGRRARSSGRSSQESSSPRCRASRVRTQSRSRLGLGLGGRALGVLFRFFRPAEREPRERGTRGSRRLAREPAEQRREIHFRLRRPAEPHASKARPNRAGRGADPRPAMPSTRPTPVDGTVVDVDHRAVEPAVRKGVARPRRGDDRFVGRPGPASSPMPCFTRPRLRRASRKSGLWVLGHLPIEVVKRPDPNRPRAIEERPIGSSPGDPDMARRPLIMPHGPPVSVRVAR